jgi:hypothetical protein
VNEQTEQTSVAEETTAEQAKKYRRKVVCEQGWDGVWRVRYLSGDSNPFLPRELNAAVNAIKVRYRKYQRELMRRSRERRKQESQNGEAVE